VSYHRTTSPDSSTDSGVLADMGVQIADVEELTAGKNQPMVIMTNDGPPIVLEKGELARIIPRTGDS
jgi:hypothetical protein